VSEELNLLTEVAVTGHTNVALPAGIGGLDDDSPPRSCPRGDYPTQLMSENKWILHSILADAAVFEPMEIRAAETDGSNADKLLARARHGVECCVQSDIAGTVETQYIHADTIVTGLGTPTSPI
jgi:hypothetical protein